MISYRHHVVSLVAVFLALAVGVVLGGGPLSEIGRDGEAASAQPARAARTAERTADFGDDFATASAKALYGERLAGRGLSILTMPGADGEMVSGLAAQFQGAGGKVVGTYDLQPVLANASEKSLVDTLGSQLMTQLGEGAVSSDASTYDRIGQLIGLAVSGTDLPQEKADSIRQSLAGAQLMNSPGEAVRSSLVLVVLGDDTDDAILSGVLSGLAAKATGVVVAGDTRSGTDGELRGLRSQPVADEVATVDGAEAPLGQVTTVLALARSLDVQGGSFGASGSDGAVPLG